MLYFLNCKSTDLCSLQCVPRGNKQVQEWNTFSALSGRSFQKNSTKYRCTGCSYDVDDNLVAELIECHGSGTLRCNVVELKDMLLKTTVTNSGVFEQPSVLSGIPIELDDISECEASCSEFAAGGGQNSFDAPDSPGGSVYGGEADQSDGSGSPSVSGFYFTNGNTSGSKYAGASDEQSGDGGYEEANESERSSWQWPWNWLWQTEVVLPTILGATGDEAVAGNKNVGGQKSSDKSSECNSPRSSTSERAGQSRGDGNDGSKRGGNKSSGSSGINRDHGGGSGGDDGDGGDDSNGKKPNDSNGSNPKKKKAPPNKKGASDEEDADESDFEANGAAVKAPADDVASDIDSENSTEEEDKDVGGASGTKFPRREVPLIKKTYGSKGASTGSSSSSSSSKRADGWSNDPTPPLEEAREKRRQAALKDYDQRVKGFQGAVFAATKSGDSGAIDLAKRDGKSAMETKLAIEKMSAKDFARWEATENSLSGKTARDRLKEIDLEIKRRKDCVAADPALMFDVPYMTFELEDEKEALLKAKAAEDEDDLSDGKSASDDAALESLAATLQAEHEELQEKIAAMEKESSDLKTQEIDLRKKRNAIRPKIAVLEGARAEILNTKLTLTRDSSGLCMRLAAASSTAEAALKESRRGNYLYSTTNPCVKSIV